MDLRNLDASLVDFAVDGGIDLSGTNLSLVDFAGSDLSNAKLNNAKLIEAILERAVLDGADFEDADVTRTNFKDAVGLTQKMLDVACASPKGHPRRLPKDRQTNLPLVWKGRSCEG